MKLDHLADDSLESPILRLYDFTPAEAASLLESTCALASGGAERVDLHELPYVSPVDGCQLTLIRWRHDAGMVRIANSEFEYRLTAGCWEDIAALIEPFADQPIGFQWLDRGPGEASLLLTAMEGGRW